MNNNIEIYKAETRGFAKYDWLESFHSFSFSTYYNPNRMRFGLLRVLNDDSVSPKSGFATHPHANMEIISIPLAGTITHQDSMGSLFDITENYIQIMSAGTGIEHSEWNHSSDINAKFLQIWIYPKELNIKPRYDMKYFNPEIFHNNFKLVVSPDINDETLQINQDAYLSLARISAETIVPYQVKNTENGVFIFVIKGNIEFNKFELNKRDSASLKLPNNTIEINAKTESHILIIEVPLIKK